MAVKPQLPGVSGGQNTGQMTGDAGPEKFGNPASEYPMGLGDMSGTHNDIGESSGFQTDGYIDKKGMVYGEGAKLNCLPPGMDIGAQKYADIRDMQMRKVTEESYPGDGWEPKPRNVK